MTANHEKSRFSTFSRNWQALSRALPEVLKPYITRIIPGIKRHFGRWLRIRRLLIVSFCFVLWRLYVFISCQVICLLSFTVLGVFPKLQIGDISNVTVVTAYLDLGTFQKGTEASDQFTLEMYLQWASAFRFLQNPQVLFVDSKEHIRTFGRLLALNSRNNVKIVFISNRTSLPAFQHLDKVRQIFADPLYPKFHPNTVLAEYACTQHAKTDFVEKAIEADFFHTKYFAWVDIGYFRHTTFRRKDFWITVPSQMDDKKVAVNELSTPNSSLTSEEIFKQNKFWVGGGMLLATADTYLQFIQDYRRAVQYFLAEGLFNTDQQVMYSIYATAVKETLAVKTELQLYRWPLSCLRWFHGQDCWFYLGYICYREQ